MKIFNHIQLAYQAMMRNRMRGILTMLGIVIGVAAVIVIGAAGEGAKYSIKATLASMGTNLIMVTPLSNDPGGTRLQSEELQTLTLKDIKAIEERSLYVSAISPSSQSEGQAIHGALNWPTTIEGVNEKFLPIRNWSLKSGTMFTEKDVKTYAKVCVLGQTVVNHLFSKGIDPIGKIIRFGKLPLQVIGVLNIKGQSAFGQDQDDVILSPYTTVQKRVTASVYFGGIYASAKSEALSDAATKEIVDLLRLTHRLRAEESNDFEVLTQVEMLRTLNTVTGLLTILLMGIAGISLLIGGIGIMNIMYVTVKERTREIGLRMSIGARGRDILSQFLIEAVLISVSGGITGIILGQLNALIVEKLMHWPVAALTYPMLISFSFCTLIGIFFGYYPALKASRLDPIEALRYE
ncbi:ABC transporter permease [Mucilaginibacter sp. JRF]|uniref:ABC transporter permease n=1 Tax=Mucilaginibacter sp. JRF TaxID=2780088 RepID=UPI001882E8D9|nr:ABC transporter permease [Mucilaginibacter sp. JRF]MBE9584078.1 ABC transporter permease [Mucilaginibacter sp. JRF]